MKLLGRINQISRKVKQLKVDRDDTVVVACGVAISDSDDGSLLVDCTFKRISREDKDRHGVLLVSRPCLDKADFATRVRQCEDYQRLHRRDAESKHLPK